MRAPIWVRSPELSSRTFLKATPLFGADTHCEAVFIQLLNHGEGLWLKDIFPSLPTEDRIELLKLDSKGILETDAEPQLREINGLTKEEPEPACTPLVRVD